MTRQRTRHRKRQSHIQTGSHITANCRSVSIWALGLPVVVVVFPFLFLRLPLLLPNAISPLSIKLITTPRNDAVVAAVVVAVDAQLRTFAQPRKGTRRKPVHGRCSVLVKVPANRNRAKLRNTQPPTTSTLADSLSLSKEMAVVANDTTIASQCQRAEKRLICAISQMEVRIGTPRLSAEELTITGQVQTVCPCLA